MLATDVVTIAAAVPLHARTCTHAPTNTRICPHAHLSTRTCRLVWNKMVILLSIAINVIMLLTWDARASFSDGIDVVNGTEVLDNNLRE